MRWDTPVLLIKMGHYPIHHGGVWIARSLGRAGVRVYALSESRVTPLATSRFTIRAGAPLDPAADDEQNQAALAAVRRGIGQVAVAVATDDEAAVWLAENRPPGFLLPEQPPELPRALADKLSLHDLSGQFGVASPRTFVPASREQLQEIAGHLTYPVVLKNSQAFARVTAPAVAETTVVPDRDELLAWSDAHYDAGHPPLIQEYTPASVAEKWSYQAYRSDRLLSSFTGLKMRDFPVGRGEATYVESRANPVVSELGDRLLAGIGYAGLSDLDFVLDRRDGVYRLIDFNPRIGAIAGMCATDDGLDLARIAYLDMTGQPVHPGQQVDGRRFQVEHRDRLARQASGVTSTQEPTVTAYAALDDHKPALVLRGRHIVGSIRRKLAR